MRRALTPIVLAVLLAAGGATARADADADRWVAWHRQRALRLDAEGRAVEASEEWRALAALLPDDPHAAAKAAVSLVEVVCGQPVAPQPEDAAYREAETLIREAVRRGALHDPAVAYAIGRLRFADGDFENAEKMLGIARRRGFDPMRARLWHYRAAVADAKRLIGELQADLVVRQMEMVLKDCPDHPDALVATIDLALAWRMRGEHLLAERALVEAVRANPSAARVHLTLGQVYGDQGKYDEAEASLRSALERSQEGDDGVFTGPAVYHDALLVIAGLERKRQRYDEAERYAQLLVTLRKDQAQALALLAAIWMDKSDQPGTAEAARRTLLEDAAKLMRRVYYQIDRGNPAYAKGLREILQRLGNEDEAEQVKKEQERLERAPSPRK